tara:strand:+ start:1062 stop:1550 length:489 start_codon:yes stop_codon:yes gene_type:complete
MKKYLAIAVTLIISVGCHGQENDSKNLEKKEKVTAMAEVPKGSWKVDKEFDEHGNLIRYDSIYSWSSADQLNDLSTTDRDSLMQSFKSRFFTNFSDFENQGFEGMFTPDSLFSKRFFNDDFFDSDFGEEFMDIDKMRQQMLERQKQFLKKYQSAIIEPDDDN